MVLGFPIFKHFRVFLYMKFGYSYVLVLGGNQTAHLPGKMNVYDSVYKYYAEKDKVFKQNWYK